MQVPVKAINNIPTSLLETLAVFLWVALGFLMAGFFVFLSLLLLVINDGVVSDSFGRKSGSTGV